jgi:hypothetical protein
MSSGGRWSRRRARYQAEGAAPRGLSAASRFACTGGYTRRALRRERVFDEEPSAGRERRVVMPRMI